jgi:hypothetical protein
MWSLYVPLIERLYKDTEEFTEADLMPQMHLRAFFFAIECIENELKPSFPYDDQRRIELINEIVNHPLCERYYGKIEIEKMVPLYKRYYELIHEKDAAGLIKARRRFERSQRKKGRRAPIAHFITEGPVIGTVYKKLRHKEK